MRGLAGALDLRLAPTDLGLDSPSTPPGYSNNLRGHGRIHRHIVLRKVGGIAAAVAPRRRQPQRPSRAASRTCSYSFRYPACHPQHSTAHQPAGRGGRLCTRVPAGTMVSTRSRSQTSTQDVGSQQPASGDQADGEVQSGRSNRRSGSGTAQPRAAATRRATRGTLQAIPEQQEPAAGGAPLPLQLPAELRCRCVCPCPALRGNRGTRGSNGELVTRMRRKSHRVPPCRRLLQAPRSRSHPCSWT